MAYDIGSLRFRVTADGVTAVSAQIKNLGTDTQAAADAAKRLADAIGPNLAQKTTTSFGQMNSSWSQFTTGLNQGLEIINKVGDSLKWAFDQAKEGAQALRVDAVFSNMLESMGRDAEDFGMKLSKAVGGTIEDTQLKLAAVRPILRGLQEETITALAGSAKVIAAVTGDNTLDVFKRLTSSISSMRTRELMSLGLYSKQEMEIIQDAATRGLLSQGQLADMINKKADEWNKKIGGTNDAVSEFQRLSALSKETWEKIVQIPLAEVFAPLTKGLNDFLVRFLEAYAKIKKAGSEGGYIMDAEGNYVNQPPSKPEKTSTEKKAEGAVDSVKQTINEKNEITELNNKIIAQLTTIEGANTRISQLEGQRKTALAGVLLNQELTQDSTNTSLEMLRTEYEYEQKILSAKIAKSSLDLAAIRMKPGKSAEEEAKVQGEIARLTNQKAEAEKLYGVQVETINRGIIAKTAYGAIRTVHEMVLETIRSTKELYNLTSTDLVEKGLMSEVDVKQKNYEYDVEALVQKKALVQAQIDLTTTTREQRLEMYSQIGIIDAQILALGKRVEAEKVITGENERRSKLNLIGSYSYAWLELQSKILNEQSTLMEKAGATQMEIEKYKWETMKGYMNSYYDSMLKSNDDFMGGFRIGMKKLELNMVSLAEHGAKLAASIQESFASSFSSFFDDMLAGKLKRFEDYFVMFCNNILKAWFNMLSQMMAQQAMSGLMGFFGGVSGGGQAAPSSYVDWWAQVPAGHQGMVAGEWASGSRNVPMSLFNNAPRLHDGLRGDEFPAILQKGERVIPKGGSSMPNISVEIKNESSQPVQGQQGKMTFDGEKYIIGVVLKDIASYGPLHHAIGRR